MGILVEGFQTIVSVTRDLDGKIWDSETQTWLPATPETKEAAAQAIRGTLNAMLDLLPFPMALDILGVIQINIDKSQMETTLTKIQATVTDYVAATSYVPPAS